MKTTAHGTFEVKIIPQPWDTPEGQAPADPNLSRFLLDKHFTGDMEGTSQGMMLAYGNGQPGSSGVYVAVEKVTATLHGRKGSFVLHHTGLMNRGVPQLTISVVLDSGTDELTGLSGDLTIERADGQHKYAFNYSLATLS